jgi:putative membrane protein
MLWFPEAVHLDLVQLSAYVLAELIALMQIMSDTSGRTHAAGVDVAAEQSFWRPQLMHDWQMWWGGGGMWFGPLWMIVWLALLVAVIVLLVRWLGGGSLGMGSPHRTPREILDERFAKGEIDQEDYDKRRKTLGV